MRILPILLLLATMTPAVSAEKSPLDRIHFMTEAYPPYNFEAGGRLRGISVDLLLRMLEESGSSLKNADIELLPWPRGYKTLLEKPGTALFATARTPKREPLFRWVGPIVKGQNVLIAKKSRHLRIDAPAQLAAYRIGVIRDVVAEQLLLAAGVSPDILERVNTAEQNLRKLDLDRIDLWATNLLPAQWQMRESGFDRERFEAVYTLSEDALYFAFNRDTDPGVIETLQAALDRLKASGEYEKILEPYR